jgi:hypothetical protein
MFTYYINIIIIVILLTFVYYFNYRQNIELYHYSVLDLDKNSYKVEYSKNYEINYIKAPLYNSANKIVGNIFSQNICNIFDNYKQVTTTTTYKFNDGVLVCNFFYSTERYNNYVDAKGTFGSIISSKPTFTSGKYFNKNVCIEVNGTNDTIHKYRILKITY